MSFAPMRKDQRQLPLRCASPSNDSLMCEGVERMLSGDVVAGKAMLRDYIKSNGGFEQLGAAIGAPAKSLIRMFGPRGNPQARNLFAVISHLQRQAALKLYVTARSQQGGESHGSS